MTRLETPIEDILGTKYYTYQLMATNYNPALNGTITIICAVSNDYNAEQPSSVILYQNDVEIGSGTLQTTGTYKDHYTWTITCDTPGLQIFRVKDTSIEVYVENKVTAIGSSSTHAQYPSAKAVYDLKQSVEIEEYDDLNDYTEVGMYYCPYSTVATTLTNCPITNAFSLFVEKSSGYENACTQTLTGFDGTRIKRFSRFIQTVNGTFQNSGWQPLYEDTGWKDVTYSSGYSAYSSSEAVRYRRIGKVVHLEGAFKNTNALTSSNTEVKFASISDSTCRPSKTQITLQQGSGANKFSLVIATNGDLKWVRYGTTVTNTSISSGSWFNCFATWFVD